VDLSSTGERKLVHEIITGLKKVAHMPLASIVVVTLLEK